MPNREANKRIVENYVEAFNRGDLDALRALLHEEAEIQGVFGRGVFEKIEPIWRQLIEGIGMQMQIEELVAEGGTVAARYTETGTFTRPAFGHQPTGKSYRMPAMEFFEIRDGRIKRRWGARDSASQWRQLGLPLD